MDPVIEKTLAAMMTYESGCPARIQHLLKVYGFCKMIGLEERLDARTLQILEVTATVHDIGIRQSLEKYGHYTGKTQEELGPAAADKLLTELGYDRELIDRVCWLVGHHHTYTDIQGLDYRILVEADFLVNLHEKNEPPEAQRAAYESIFQTETGRRLCREHFPAVCA